MSGYKQPSVSVVVPVYNGKKYLRQCLDSIVGQTLRDMEIIVINDGSTDGSLEIINEYANKDDRVIVIDKPNEGYGKTMNRGIEAATGEFIGIVESDDWIEPDMVETLYGITKLHNVDVVKSRYIPFDDRSGKTGKMSSMPEHDTERVIDPRRNSLIFYVQPSIWSAIYRREFLNANKIRFLESPGASFQDTSFNFKVWAMAKRAYLTMQPLVYYRVGHTGQSVKSRDKVFCVCDEFREVERYMASHPASFRKLEKIFNRVKYNSYLWNFNRLDGENRESFRKQIQTEFIPILNHNAMDMTGMTRKGRLNFLKIIYPKSIWVKIRYALVALPRLLLKDRQRNGVIETRILFGLIVIRKKPVMYQGVE